GLERSREVWERIGSPRPAGQIFTVAGTNGKGSSISALEMFYKNAGYLTGCYTSPHLTVFNERIRVAGAFVSDEKICSAFSKIDSSRGDVPLTYFEFATLAAFIIFTESELDVVLLEVGLGGRLDATNLFPADLALITSIGLDHTDWLGKDRESIAVEKAGIIHEGKIVVIADTDPPDSLMKIANTKAKDVYLINQHYSYRRHHQSWNWKSQEKGFDGLPFSGLKGSAQFNNLAGVLMCLTALKLRLPVSDDVIVETLPGIYLMGRFQVLDNKPLIVLDVSHNPDSVALLAENLQQQVVIGKTYAIVAMLKDKDISQSLQNVLSCIDHWTFTELDVSRGENPEVLKNALLAVSPASDAQIITEINQAWEHVYSQAGDDDRIVVFGSFHTVGAIIDCLSLTLH
ncbi:MAG: bifunctional tetrahydrofolate synthase/dihydrofolate synthase, partial [Gammaproteobacteria bacterium]|nr:bifunctional tetrahydrofolate synthase/dihydrofolate synthase [Gammaproteobacteria bacterium]